VWAAPQLSDEVRQQYKPAKGQAASYTVADHPQLANPQIREIYDALDARIRALNPNVTARVPGVGVIPWGSQPRRSRG